ncbi:sulfurtransferase TusA family protein [Methylopila turkensis]|uniref:UPF0033 domain-containing protein n=1 Tax=Methylopila turkensis TaxID=1437816 RepID=A0A9W6JRA4_9HYPH|nr:sulfurtransferase TusA family protein [Methylopila turkensis]GLK80585.1 hypothetical protein GCM10008174_23260 [Methylopila turkensis]
MSGASRRLDLRGLKCPLPALMTRKTLATLAAGARLEVLADDPLAGLDLPNAVREAGGAVLELTRDGAVVRVVATAGPD